MKNSFWKRLEKPFFILAPMADVTDSAFMQIILECSNPRTKRAEQSSHDGKPDVFYTEFVSCEGLCSEKGKPKLMPHLTFKENERPIIAQFFGANPQNFYKCAQLAVKLGFDGIDINMGCPAGKIVKQDSGSGLILNPELAQEIIRETKRGIGDAALLRQGFEGSSRSSIPVSIKTRIGYNSIITEEWITKLIEAKPDVINYAEGVEKANQYNLDGIMVGRGVFHNPWFFDSSINPTNKTPDERIALLKKHINNFVELWGNDKNFAVMKRFIKIYINDFPACRQAGMSAKNLRDKLMQTKTSTEILALLC